MFPWQYSIVSCLTSSSASSINLQDSNFLLILVNWPFVVWYNQTARHKVIWYPPSPISYVYKFTYDYSKNFFKVLTVQHTRPLCSALSRIHCNDQQIIVGLFTNFILKVFWQKANVLYIIDICHVMLILNTTFFAITQTVKFMNKTKEKFHTL